MLSVYACYLLPFCYVPRVTATLLLPAVLVLPLRYLCANHCASAIPATLLLLLSVYACYLLPFCYVPRVTATLLLPAVLVLPLR